MANVKSIHSVCNSIVQYLHNEYEVFPVPGEVPGRTLQEVFPCSFRVLSSGELASNSDFGTSLTLYLYRVFMNEHIRNQPYEVSAGRVISPLSVDLHFLVTVWADSAAAEQTICAWVMSQLNRQLQLDVSSLSEEGGWRNDEIIQIIPAELSNEDLMRVWDALTPGYRLSLSYIARVVRIDPPESPTGLPVVASRFSYEQKQDHVD